MNQQLNEIITAQEAADILGISKRQTIRYCLDGTLDARNAGAVWLVLKSSVIAFRKQREVFH